MKKIDIHCHSTPKPLRGLAYEDASLHRIREAMGLHSIEKTVLYATYFPHRGSGVSNYRLWDWIRDDSRFLMFGSLDLDNYLHQGLNELAELADQSRICGIKIYSSYQHTSVCSGKVRQVAALAQEYGLPLAFHCGYPEGVTDSSSLESSAVLMTKASDIIYLCHEYGLNVIACHLANPFYDDLIRCMKSTDRLYADMSGLISSCDEPHLLCQEAENIRRVLGDCGPGRLLFGTDFPIQTHEDSISLIELAMSSCPDEDKMLVYYGNAAQLLKLA